MVPSPKAQDHVTTVPSGSELAAPLKLIDVPVGADEVEGLKLAVGGRSVIVTW